MRRTFSIAALLLIGLGRLSAQSNTYPLIELSMRDSTDARAVHDKTQKDWDSLYGVMWKKYVDLQVPGLGNGRFSDDYRFWVGGADPAPTVELIKEDTAKLIAVRDLLARAKKDAESFRQHILTIYVAARPGERAIPTPDGFQVPEERRKFLTFRYTQDYRFIVGLL